MNRTQLKYIVILAMLIDHIAWAFVPTASIPGQLMHFIGRLTAPTMAFFVAEGYIHTHNIKNYALVELSVHGRHLCRARPDTVFL